MVFAVAQVCKLRAQRKLGRGLLESPARQELVKSSMVLGPAATAQAIALLDELCDQQLMSDSQIARRRTGSSFTKEFCA